MIASASKINALPESLAGIVVLATLSASTGSGLAARLFRDKVTRGNLYLLAAVASGGGKSVTFEPQLKPFSDVQADLLDHWRREVWPKTKATQAALRGQLDHLRRRIKSAKTQADTDAIVCQMARIEAELVAIEGQLVEPALSVEDVTTEMLAVVMQQNKETSALISSDGGDVVANIAGRYRKGEAVDDNLYVKSYSGDPVKVSRLNRPTIHLKSPCLTILLMVQPDKLAHLMSKRRLTEGGLMPRFLMARVNCPPAYVNAEPVEIPASVVSAYSAAVTKLTTAFRLAETAVLIKATQAARQVIADYHNRIVDRRATDLEDVAVPCSRPGPTGSLPRNMPPRYMSARRPRSSLELSLLQPFAASRKTFLPPA